MKIFSQRLKNALDKSYLHLLSCLLSAKTDHFSFPLTCKEKIQIQKKMEECDFGCVPHFSQEIFKKRAIFRGHKNDLIHWVFGRILKLYIKGTIDFIYFYLFIFGCIGSLLLRAGFLQLWRVGATLHCGAWASHCGGFSCCGAWALGTQAPVVAAHGLSSRGSKALECVSFSSYGTWAQ